MLWHIWLKHLLLYLPINEFLHYCVYRVCSNELTIFDNNISLLLALQYIVGIGYLT